MMVRKLLKNRGLGLNLIAGVCFILLLANGWGLSWRELGGYLVALLVLLVSLVGLAALCGWVLHKLSRRSDISTEHSHEADQIPAREISVSEPKEKK